MQGVYTLIISLSQGEKITVGKLGITFFPAGYHIYTGSALGSNSTSLFGRIRRHLSKEKKKHWHIDYLLDATVSKVVCVILSETTLRKEHEVVNSLEVSSKFRTVMKGFGSSDCRSGCTAHLQYYSGQELADLENLVCKAYRSMGLNPKKLEPSLIRDLHI